MAKDDTREMLKTLINNLSTFKQEVFTRIDKLDKKLSQKIDNVDKNLSGRIDKIGKQLAYLEDDSPTKEEFNKLERRVGKLEQKSSRI